ncbi:protein Atg16l2 isoform X2 [Pelobates fuscus]|uniref:protein Atg16l2 isoform X2 n=1 Tax=Pelobates fuscus TaxID=191477 RepID=UPI002FE4D466
MAAWSSSGDPSSRPPWRRHIGRQLRARDHREKSAFQELIQQYNKLLEKSSLLKELTETLPTDPLVFPAGQVHRLRASTSGSNLLEDAATQQREVEDIKTFNGKLACDACSLKHQVEEQDKKLSEQNSRVKALWERTALCCAERDTLEENVNVKVEANAELKQEYDLLLCRRQVVEETLQKEELEAQTVLEQLNMLKAVRAENQNKINESGYDPTSQILVSVCWSNAIPIIDFHLNASSLEHSSVTLSGSLESVKKQRDRSLSVPHGPAKVIEVFKKLFDFSPKKEQESLYTEQTFYLPSSICVVCGLPDKVVSSKEIHDSEIHAVKFSPNSRVVATGGTDRVVKLWEVTGGILQEYQTLEGSRGGITSIEFDPSGLYVLAASFDGAAHLWKLDGKARESLTGHSNKVTAARFKMGSNRAVTGSKDRTVKEWDLQKAACVRSISVTSYCTDVVCCDSCIISGHCDKKIRFWDSRSESCIKEVTLEDKITSLFLNQDQTQLLSCSRDDTLSLIDLRLGNILQEFRAEGFKCGCDWTKAILSPDGSYALAGSVDGTIFVWNVLKGCLERSMSGQHSSSVNAVTWSLSGSYVVSVDRGRKAVLWSEF